MQLFSQSLNNFVSQLICPMLVQISNHNLSVAALLSATLLIIEILLKRMICYVCGTLCLIKYLMVSNVYIPSNVKFPDSFSMTHNVAGLHQPLSLKKKISCKLWWRNTVKLPVESGIHIWRMYGEVGLLEKVKLRKNKWRRIEIQV